MILALLCAAVLQAPPADAPLDSWRAAKAWIEATADGVTGGTVEPHFLGDGAAFTYRVTDGDGAARTVRVDPAAGTRRTLPPGAEPERDAFGGYGVERLTERRRSGGSGIETHVTFRNDTAGPVRLFWLSAGGAETGYATVEPGGEYRQHTFAGHVWLAKDADGEAVAAFAATGEEGFAVVSPDAPRPAAPPTKTGGATSPDGAAVARIAGRDVRVKYRGEDVTLTDAAAEPVPDGFDWIAYRGPLLWSPDGKTLSTVRVAVAPVDDLVLSDPGEAGTARPTIRRVRYPKPGDPIDRPAPVLFDVESGRRIDVETDRFPNPYSLTRFRWAADSSELFFLHNPRGHGSLDLLAADRRRGTVRVVIGERSDTFVDYSQKTELHWPEDGSILWASERSGWNHLYRINPATGRVRNAVTGGEWVVRGVEKVEGGRVWFRAGGVVPGQDPYFVHLCRADLDGGNFAVLTSDDAEPGDGTHEWTFTPDGEFLLDRFSRVDLPPVTVLRNAETGRLIRELERADASARLATGWRPPVRFAAEGRDGTTDIHGLILFPPGHNPATAKAGSLPIVEAIYAGPHGAHVPKAWGRQRAARELAALGFAVVKCDGMGTNWRSKAFHDVCFRNLADAGFPDRIAFIKAAAERFPALDVKRVGIYGGSAGGQNALRAVLSHGDFYSAAAADCGCHDNRVDKRWWNEAWMGLPGPHYDASSNARDAADLTGELLLTVGGLDRNVDPASTLQVVDALIAADKDFELVVFPRGGHGIGESDYGRRRRAEFFRRALLNP